MLDLKNAPGNLTKAHAIALLLCKGRLDYLLYKAAPRVFHKTLALLGYAADERYSRMQKTFYEGLATLSSEAVVGFFDEHEGFSYEDFLLRNAPRDGLDRKLALDFGC